MNFTLNHDSHAARGGGSFIRAWAGSVAGGALLAAMMVAGGGAVAQTQYPDAQYQAPGAYPNAVAPSGEPAFRDPVTGRVYTPSNVSKDGTPVAPEDRAFDPRSQQGTIPVAGTIQHPPATLIGAVPITAGPGSRIPALTFEPGDLRNSPDGHWVLQLVVANNAGYPISPQIQCAFSNGASVLEIVAVRLDTIPAGQRAQAAVYGPRSDRMFVDNAPCVGVGQ